MGKFYQDYKYETDEEIERKRGVVRAFILARENLEYNEARMEALSRIVRSRQRTKMRRELLEELKGWAGLAGVFGGGIGATYLFRYVPGWLGF